MLRFRLSITKNNIIKYWVTLFLGFTLLGCDQSNHIIQQTLSQHLLNRSIYTEQFQLDPIFVTSTEDSAPLRDLLSGLMVFNEKGDVTLGLAENWQTEDGKVWIFKLKQDARWSNNAPVTAQDFVSSWQRLASHKNQSPVANYLVYMGVKNAQAVISGKKFTTDLGVMAIDEKTLKIELNRTNFQLPLMLAHSALLPTYRGEKPALTQSFISNGKYRLQYPNKANLILTAIDTSLPFQKVIYHKLDAQQQPKYYDIIENPSLNYTNNLIKLPKLCTYFYEFNFADPMMQKQNIRQAIKGMVSARKITDNIGVGIPNNSILPNTMYIENNSQWKPVIIELLLSEAGISVKNPLKITLTYDNQSIHHNIANNIIRSLGQSDLFKVTPQAVEWQELLKIREKKQFQMIRAGWCADFPDPVQFLVQFHSKSPDNKISYKNNNVDTLLEQLEQEPLTISERNKLIYKVIKQLEDDVAILPIFQYQRTIAVVPSIKGIDSNNSSGVIYSKDLYRASPTDQQTSNN
ncbi:peptide ABC transporter substrate-binding protein [Phocoenobacter skyensis]|nr:peptide ABC transporter substrate-binding protein [Pasteurella skyensis]MDP8079754.1 peptide ABC transporter substrate-binding protein [Pasteurella skyensis]MDP8085671.1 peptide ABC transporter substrate-binding protein [Pasteurella skyensis]MDP8185440.1 peptide ABC transporter substrate-binding protein [Pasteurella skyensis]QLB23664.1 hypothetical protein A6B44_03290 [Pasteurella skyensis]